MTAMPDPMSVFPRDRTGKLRGGIYRHIKLHLVRDAIALGWIVMPPNGHPEYPDQFSVLCHWVQCACGRGMPVPAEMRGPL
jgi:hypothetical protein